MKRDDFGVRIDEIRELATKYSKQDLARMVKMGMLDPQRALMAGMMIDRIAQSAMRPPQTTVAEDVLSPQMPTTAQGQMPPGIMAAPNAPAPSAGVAALPSGIREMAGGGIVAFADGGDVPGYADGDLVSASDVFRRGLATQPDGMMPPPAADAGVSPLTLPGGFKFREYAPVAPTNIKAEIAREREALREAGVDTELFKRIREEEAARRDELKARREEAKGEALLMAGLGLMGARRGQEFEVLGNVGRQAVQQYSSSLREIRDTEKDIKKTERELSFAEDRAKRDVAGRGLAAVKAKEEKLDALEVRKTDQFNEAIKAASNYWVDTYKIDKQTATQMAIAQFEADQALQRTKLDIASRERIAYAPSDSERILAKAQALQKAGKEAEANNLITTYNQIKFGSQRTGEITRTTAFKEYNDLVEKDIVGKFQKQYPTFEDYWKAVQKQAGAAPAGTVDTSNPLLR